MKVKFIISFLICSMLAYSCKETEETSLAPADERIAEAKNDLISELTAPANGWLLEYQPVNEAGTYLILLNFNTDGTVTIQSDVSGTNTDFHEDTIPYRIDARLSLELILETYSVFHFLFEQRFSTFQAEFEFLYIDKFANNLVFLSKSDTGSEQTILTFTPAPANAEELLSGEIANNLNTFEKFSPQFQGATPAIQIAIPSENLSVFCNVDFLERTISADVVAEGATLNDVIANDNSEPIDQSSGYQIADEKIILASPISFSFAGNSYTISEIELTNFETTGEIYCASAAENSPVYSGNISGIGGCTIYKTLYEQFGTQFVPHSERPYTVNVIFIFDPQGASLALSGSINEHFPEASGFIFNYGLDDTEEPAYALGLSVPDENGVGQRYMREFEMTSTTGNQIQINLLDDYYFSGTTQPNDMANLEAITNEIVGDGNFYASGLDFDDDNLQIFRLFNPCSGYEVYLVYNLL